MNQKIRTFYQRGYHARHWYERERHEAQRIFGDDAKRFLGFLAATSTNSGITGNVTLALKAFKQWRKGEPFTGYLESVQENLRRIRDDNYHLAGPKVGEFCRALLGDRHATVVDRWMKRAYDESSLQRVQEHILQDAKTVVEYPANFQAAVWSGIRGRATPYYEVVRAKLGVNQISLNL